MYDGYRLHELYIGCIFTKQIRYSYREILDMASSKRYNEAMNKSTSKHPRFSAYIPATLLERLKQQAHLDRRSMNAQLVWYLECGLQRSEPQKRQPKEEHA